MANDQGTWIGWRNAIETATLTTAADQVGSRIVNNLKTSESDDFWRFLTTNSATSASITATWAQDQAIGAVTLQFTRGAYPGVSESAPALGASDTIRYRLYDASDALLWDSTAVGSAIVPGYMTHYGKPNSSIAAVRKLVVDIDAASRESAGFCDVGSLGAWQTIEPRIGFAYPADFGWTVNTENQRTSVGRLYTARFEPMRRWSLEFDALSNAESLQIDEMVRFSGGARPVAIRRGDLPVGRDLMHALVTSQPIGSRTAELRQVPFTFDEFI